MRCMGPLLCFWTGGIRRAEQKMPQCGIFPPRGAMARSCAAWKANSKRPARRIPPSPPKQRAHALHGPSALLLDRWDSKGGTGVAPVEPRPAPGRTGKRLRRAERKQAAARAENPTLLREQAGRTHAAHGPSALLLDRWDSKGGTENAAVRHFPAPGASPRPGGAPSRWSLAPPRWSPVPGASPRPGKNGRGNRSGQRADAPRERRGERQRLAPKHPFHSLQIRSSCRFTSFQASPANRRGSRPPRSPR